MITLQSHDTSFVHHSRSHATSGVLFHISMQFLTTQTHGVLAYVPGESDLDWVKLTILGKQNLYLNIKIFYCILF